MATRGLARARHTETIKKYIDSSPLPIRPAYRMIRTSHSNSTPNASRTRLCTSSIRRSISSQLAPPRLIESPHAFPIPAPRRRKPLSAPRPRSAVRQNTLPAASECRTRRWIVKRLLIPRPLRKVGHLLDRGGHPAAAGALNTTPSILDGRGKRCAGSRSRAPSPPAHARAHLRPDTSVFSRCPPSVRQRPAGVHKYRAASCPGCRRENSASSRPPRWPRRAHTAEQRARFAVTRQSSPTRTSSHPIVQMTVRAPPSSKSSIFDPFPQHQQRQPVRAPRKGRAVSSSAMVFGMTNRSACPPIAKVVVAAHGFVNRNIYLWRGLKGRRAFVDVDTVLHPFPPSKAKAIYNCYTKPQGKVQTKAPPMGCLFGERFPAAG